MAEQEIDFDIQFSLLSLGEMTSFSIDHILGINNNTDDASNQQHFIASAALPQHQQPIHFWNYPAVPVHPVIVSPNDCYWPSPVAAAAAWFIQQQQQHQQVINGIFDI